MRTASAHTLLVVAAVVVLVIVEVLVIITIIIVSNIEVMITAHPPCTRSPMRQSGTRRGSVSLFRRSACFILRLRSSIPPSVVRQQRGELLRLLRSCLFFHHCLYRLAVVVVPLLVDSMHRSGSEHIHDRRTVVVVVAA